MARETGNGPKLVIPKLKVTSYGKTARQRKVYCLGVQGSKKYAAFKTDLRTALRAVRERVFYIKEGTQYRAPPMPAGVNYVRKTLRATREALLPLIKMETYTKWSADEFIAHYTGAKRTRYEKAYELYMRDGVTTRDARIRGFLKFEKIESNNPVKPWDTKVCRLISPRSSVYNLALGRWIMPLEPKVFDVIGKMYGEFREDKVEIPTILKGMNSIETARVIVQKYRMFEDPRIVCLDAKRWDQHVNEHLLRWEHGIYLAFMNNDKDRRTLAGLLAMQIHNNVTVLADDGNIKYKKTGGRMSGDMNTSLGNCLLMTSCMHAYLRHLGITKAEVGNNGDDTFVILEERDVQLFTADLHNWWSQMGITMDLEGVVKELTELRFCQTYVINRGDTHVMMRDFRDAISKDTVSLKPLPTKKMRAAYCYAIGKGGLALHAGIPVLQAFYERLIKLSSESGIAQKVLNKYTDYFLREEYNRQYLRVGMAAQSKTVSWEARVDFFESTGVTPDLQVALEAQIQTMAMDLEVGMDNLPHVLRWL